MTPEEKDITLIERYLRKELNEEERMKVEERLRSDTSFEQKMKWHEDFMDVVREDRNQEIKSFLKEVEAEKNYPVDADIKSGQDEKVGTKVIELKWIRWAAAVLVFGFLTWAIWSQLSMSPQKLYAEHFTTYPNDLVRVERSVAETDPLQSAFVAYQDKEFDSAIQQFDQLLANASSDNILFFKAVALLSKGDTKGAVTILEGLNTLGDWQYTEAVRWYLALSYLKSGQTDNAKTLLEQIANQEGGHFQQSGAMEILEQL